MTREIQILENLCKSVLEEAYFDISKCDATFWKSFLVHFIDFEQDRKPFYVFIYSLELNNPEKAIQTFENLYQPFLDQLAEETVLGYTSECVEKLLANTYFNQRVHFYKNLEKAIAINERKQLKRALPAMYDKYAFEISDNELRPVITKLERQALKDKMKGWDKELTNVKEHSNVFSSNQKPAETKVIKLTWVKYAAAACIFLVIGIVLFNQNTNEVKPDIDVVIDEDKQMYKLNNKLPRPELMEATKKSSWSKVIINEGLGFSSNQLKIKVVEINNQDRIVSIQKAIFTYQEYLEKELLNSIGDGPLFDEIKAQIEALNKELNTLKAQQNTYLFDENTLTLFDINNSELFVLTYEDTFYLKSDNNFFKLTESKQAKSLQKLNDKNLTETLDKILFENE